VPLRAPAAEAFLAGEIDWDRLTAPPGAVGRFGELVRDAARPISDHRSTADYRRHAIGVIATRAARRSLAA
jgi:CO/xanthine dehydrogenase FAD-binding subunit